MTRGKIIAFAFGPIGAAALSLFTMPFVTWYFTVEDIGRLTMLQLSLSLTVALFSLAMHQAYVREYHEEKDKSALFKASILPGLILLILSLVIISILPFSISDYLFGIDSSILTIFLFVGLISSYFINFLAHVVRMQERGIAFSLAQITPKLFFLVLIGILLLFNIGAEFQYLLMMNTLALFTSFLILCWLTRDTWTVALIKKIDFILLKKMLKFSLPLVFGGLAYWGLTTMDRFFLRSMSGFEELGVYALSVTLAGAVAVISTIFSNLWHPTVYKWINEGVQPDKVQRVIENMVLLVAAIWSLVGILSWIIPFFFPKDYKAIEYLFIACVSMPLLYMLSETTVVGIGISRKTTFSMLASFVAFITNAILNYYLIPVYGASGAAMATVFSFFIFFTVRTEASSILWFSMPRVKVYIVVFLYVLLTLVVVLTKNTLGYINFYWLILLLMTIFLFFDRVDESIIYLKNYFKREV